MFNTILLVWLVLDLVSHWHVFNVQSKILDRVYFYGDFAKL